MLRTARGIAKQALPAEVVHWYRRRRLLRHYFRTLGEELWQQRIRATTEDVQGRLEAARKGFTDATVKEIINRTDILLQALERKIEGLTARHGNQIRALREEMNSMRQEIVALRAQVASVEVPGALEPAGTPDGTAELAGSD